METVMVSKIDELSSAWQTAKMAEDQARDLRVDIENKIIAELGGAPKEGDKTHPTPSGDKITLSQPISRKVDGDRWLEIRGKLPAPIQTVMDEKISYNVDKAGLEWLKANEPGYYRLVCQCFTEKPGKVGIKIQPMEVE